MAKEKHYIARMETRHYSWLAVGRTEKEAKNAVLTAWNASPYRDTITMEELEEEGLTVDCLEDGECLVE